MKSSVFLGRNFKLIFLLLFLCNFNAVAQKTTIWIVNHAEKADKTDFLSDTGQIRAHDLMKTLKHAGIDAIYVTPENVSAQTVSPLAAQIKILPRVYTDSAEKFADIIKRNFIGKKVLIVADSKTILSFISAFGADSPFDSLDEGDHDQLFSITIKASGDAELSVRYYGKAHHVNPIPQSYILDNFSPGLPGH